MTRSAIDKQAPILHQPLHLISFVQALIIDWLKFFLVTFIKFVGRQTTEAVESGVVDLFLAALFALFGVDERGELFAASAAAQVAGFLASLAIGWLCTKR
ncbi:hypothetical protein BHU62_01340 [Serratia marcescens]|uniref:Uncharacterized protein n=1 Tax=Serratia marcescens TaxID=615 RepID=A0A1Q4P6I4_SERMA|nr:hypothetical protein [Serratia marcescens]OKB68717.1 hypothetical protein BHU62_01340 [Serratia marcescens]